MEVIIKKDGEACGRLAARLIAGLIKEKPNAVLGLATGRTPEPMYSELVKIHQKEKLSFKKVTTFNLDEYVGLSPKHPASYSYYMDEKLFKHIDVPKKQIHIPNGLAKDIPASCMKYEREIKKAKGIDLQVLGLGSDGHIGFNEPSSSLSSRTRIKTLTLKTVKANKVFFASGETMPRHVITMGIGTIMEARQCVLLAYGNSKAEVVAKMVEGPITALVPASILQLHPKTVIIIDEAASSKLKLLDYYRFVYDNKPEWQKYE
jgi:glucosamine-6-phosphate deaminase